MEWEYRLKSKHVQTNLAITTCYILTYEAKV